MPYASAFAAGATHALVLRSREAGYRKSDYHGLQVALVGRRLPKIRQAFRERPARYNDEAAELEAAHRDGRGDLRQIVPPQTDDPVSQLERDPRRSPPACARAPAPRPRSSRAATSTCSGSRGCTAWVPRPASPE